MRGSGSGRSGGGELVTAAALWMKSPVRLTHFFFNCFRYAYYDLRTTMYASGASQGKRNEFLEKFSDVRWTSHVNDRRSLSDH